MNINDYFSEYDNFRFEDNVDYSRYFDLLSRVIRKFNESIKNNLDFDKIENGVIQANVTKFSYTLELLNNKYSENGVDKLAIDLSHSCFPNYLELKKLEDDYQYIIDNQIGVIPEINLKKELLENLFTKSNIDGSIINKISKNRYYSQLKNKKFFKKYNEDSIIKLPIEYGSNSYFYTWSSYHTVTNRIYIYMMYFDFDNITIDITKEGMPTLKEIVKKNSYDDNPLSLIAMDIDKEAKSLKPKLLKRVEIGPLYCEFSKDNTEITQIYKNQKLNNEFLLKYNIEVVKSIGEKNINGSIFKSGNVVQDFYINKSKIETLERKISDYEAYILSTHKIMQILNYNNSKEIENLKKPPTIVEYE